MTFVLIPLQIIRSLEKAYHQPNRDIEKGGIILGLRKKDAIEVTAVTFPSKKDIGTPTRFHRSHEFHQQTAMSEWQRSKGTIDWVGDWHTHPNSSAHPSSIDQREWRKITAHTRKQMLFLIVGHNSQFYALQNEPAGKWIKLGVIERDKTNILLK